LSSFSLLCPLKDGRYCHLLKMPGDMKNMALPSRGKPMGALYADARDFRMSESSGGMQVPDVITNAFNYLMVTEKLKLQIEASAKGAKIEYLPFRVINHKGRVAAESCFIVNVLGTIDCADKSASEGLETAIYKGEYTIADRITLIDGKIPKSTNIFRTSLFPPGVWLSADLRKTLEGQGVKARFVAAGENI
jgi:hypothetical protein